MELIFKKNKGFTLIEMVISVFLIAIALVGIFNAFSVISILTSDSADRLTGTYLAQEGMEIARNIRDANWLSMDSMRVATGTNQWTNSLRGCGATGCEADYTGATPMGPWSGTGRYLCIDTNGFYYYTNTACGAATTKFKRKITVSCLNSSGNPDTDCLAADYIMKVKVQVSWNEKATILYPSGASAANCNLAGGPANCVTAEETLYNWYNFVNH